MSFPTVLSPSPLREAFSGIQYDPLEKLRFSDPEKSLIRSAEENPLDYTLNDPRDAESYARILLKIVDFAISSTSDNQGLKVSKLDLHQRVPDDEALQFLYVDLNGVWLHYSISKLSEVVISLKGSDVKATISSTFYPSGVLVDDWRLLHRILSGSKSDPYAQRGAAFCLACILSEGCSPDRNAQLRTPVVPVLKTFISSMTARLQSASSQAALAVVTPSLTVIIGIPEARRAFDEAGGIGYMCRHLRFQQADPYEGSSKAGSSVQLLYELTFCLWLLSFDCFEQEKIRKHFYRDGAVPALVDIVAASPREKVVRVAIATLRNLATCRSGTYSSTKGINGQSFQTEMIGSGLVRYLDRMKDSTILTDQDLVDDVSVLLGLLNESYSSMTRWDLYQSEVESAHLQWGILHNEKFFRENIRKFEGSDGKFKLVRTLTNLAASADEDVAAIACFDLGEFARLYPNGKVIAKTLGIREAVIGLIDHRNEELQKQAVMTISKLLVRNWESIK